MHCGKLKTEEKVNCRQLADWQLAAVEPPADGTKQASEKDPIPPIAIDSSVQQAASEKKPKTVDRMQGERLPTTTLVSGILPSPRSFSTKAPALFHTG